MPGSGRSRSRSRSRSTTKNGVKDGAGLSHALAAADEVVWVQYTTPEGYPYFHQRESGQTVWQRPCGPNDRVAAAPVESQAAGAEVVWMRCCTAAGQLYYHQPQTQQTVWDMPRGPTDRIVDHPAMPAAQAQLQAAAACGGLYGAGTPMGALPAGVMPGYYTPTPCGAAMCNLGAVEAWIQKNDIDVSAATKLRALSPAQQRQVIDRGDLQDARNPNAVLMGRIRDAERSSEAARCSPGPAANTEGMSEVDKFVAENRIDASAGDRLRALPQDLQRAVMGRGGLTDARNPNAVLMSRIRDAERGA